MNNVSNNLSNLAGNVTNMNNTVNNIVNGGGVKYFHGELDFRWRIRRLMVRTRVAIGGNAQATTANSVALGSTPVANSATLVATGRLHAGRRHGDLGSHGSGR